MKVLAFTDEDWLEASGGVERSLMELYPRIVSATDIDICWVTLASGGLPRRGDLLGVNICRGTRISLESLTGAQVAISTDVWGIAKRTIERIQPDLIHSHTLFYHTSLVAAAVAKRYRIPLMLTLHLGSLDALPLRYRNATRLYERTIGRLLLASASHVTCVSDDVRRHALSLGVPDSRLAVVPNGVDINRFTPRTRSAAAIPVVVCVGRLIFNKGQQFLLEAVASLRRQGLALRLVLAGDGPMERRLRQQAAMLQLTDYVEFCGRSDTIPALLADADIFVRPSLTDGMSLAVLEAMAAGLPIIATDVSGTRQMIEHDRDGLVIPPGSVPALAHALARLLQDEELCNRLGGHARQRAVAYDWSSIAVVMGEQMKYAHLAGLKRRVHPFPAPNPATEYVADDPA